MQPHTSAPTTSSPHSHSLILQHLPAAHAIQKKKRKGNARGVIKGARQASCSVKLKQSFLVTYGTTYFALLMTVAMSTALTYGTAHSLKTTPRVYWRHSPIACAHLLSKRSNEDMSSACPIIGRRQCNQSNGHLHSMLNEHMDNGITVHAALSKSNKSLMLQYTSAHVVPA